MLLNKDKIKKILCIKPRGVGDIVLSTIVLENLIAHFKDAEIHYLTEAFAVEAIKFHPLVRKVISYQKKDFLLNTVANIRREKYDLVIDLYSNPRTAQFTFLSGVKYRTGFAYRGRKYAYNILSTSEKGKHHAAEHNLELIKSLGVKIISKNISFHFDNDAKTFADNFFANNFNKDEKVIGLIHAGGWETKKCEPEKWIGIINDLHNKTGIKMLIFGGEDEQKDLRFIKNNFDDEFLSIAPLTGFAKLGAMLNKCSLVIANDSGPMHIAAALKIPILGIFGPTDPNDFAPYSENSDVILKDDLFCITCNKLVCPYNHECMFQLSVDAVVKKSLKLLGSDIRNA